MAHKTIWIVERRVLYTHFSGNISQPELEGYMNDIVVEIPKGIPMVHQITNSLEMGKVEVSLKTLQTLINGYKMVSALGWNIDINRNPINKMFAGIGSQIARARFRTFSTMDEAVAFLREHDDTLVNVQWNLDTPVEDTLPLNNLRG